MLSEDDLHKIPAFKRCSWGISKVGLLWALCYSGGVFFGGLSFLVLLSALQLCSQNPTTPLPPEGDEYEGTQSSHRRLLTSTPPTHSPRQNSSPSSTLVIV